MGCMHKVSFGELDEMDTARNDATGGRTIATSEGGSQMLLRVCHVHIALLSFRVTPLLLKLLFC